MVTNKKQGVTRTAVNDLCALHILAQHSLKKDILTESMVEVIDSLQDHDGSVINIKSIPF